MHIVVFLSLEIPRLENTDYKYYSNRVSTLEFFLAIDVEELQDDSIGAV
jgi:hypothetical protein